MRLRKILKIGTAGLVTAAVAGTIYSGTPITDVATTGVVRFGRAAFVAARIGVDYKRLFHKYPDTTHPEYASALKEMHLNSAIRLRALCCKNGGVFIKVGQHLGTLEYLLPIEYVETMRVLQNQAPQSDVGELKQVILEDLGKTVEEMFVHFDPEPLGAASLAQVHKARLSNGLEVAVKIQHPKVKAHSRVDIRTMEFLVHALGWVFPEFDFIWLAEETKKNLPVELDFINEGHNCEKIGQLLKKFNFLKVPKIYWDLSSDRVLTMEYCDGGKVDDSEYMKKHGISINEVVERLAELYSEMIFVQGYVHCDPHPGNVLVKQTKQGPQIIMLDHGLYQTLTDDFRVHYSKMWMAMINADVTGMKEHADALNVGDFFGLFACMLTARSWEALQAGIDRHKVTSEESLAIRESVGGYLMEITTILRRVPRQMLLLLKTNDVLRGIESALKSRPSSASFINMARCCVKAVSDQELSDCSEWKCYLRNKIRRRIQLARISIYSFYLLLLNSPLGFLFHTDISFK